MNGKSDHAHELENWLNQEVSDQTARHSFSGSDRARWLSNKLVESMDRWIGIAVVSRASMHQLLSNMLFCAIEIAGDALDREMASGSPADLRETWDRLYAKLSRKEWSDVHEFSRFHKEVQDWQRRLRSIDW